MATPDTNPNQSYIQGTKARIKATQEALSKITEGAQKEYETAAQAPAQVKAAYGEKGKAAAAQAEYAGGLQLAQQTGQGMGYNKAAARQEAMTTGIAGGTAIGEAKAAGEMGALTAQKEAAKQRTDAASQLLEQLKAEQEIATGQKKEELETKNRIKSEMTTAVTSTTGADDNEPLAISNLQSVYNNNSDELDNDPAMKKYVLNSIAAIAKDKYGDDWNDMPQELSTWLYNQGYGNQDWTSVAPNDYGSDTTY